VTCTTTTTTTTTTSTETIKELDPISGGLVEAKGGGEEDSGERRIRGREGMMALLPLMVIIVNTG